MSDDKFQTYLKDRYEDQVNWYDKKSMYNQKLAKRFQYAIIILSAITPVFAALQYKWFTISSSSMVAALVGILKYCKFEELWHNYRTTCETMKKEKVMFDQKISIYDSATDLKKLFVERVEALISRENTVWTQTMSKKDKKIKKS